MAAIQDILRLDGRPLEQQASELTSGASRHVVEVVGHVLCEDEGRKVDPPHLEYVILSATTLLPPSAADAPPAAARPHAGATSPSHTGIVQRRFSEFDRLRAALQPVARQAGLSLPALPSKLRLRRNVSSDFAARRQEGLQQWLGRVVSRPELWSDALRAFLGLPASEVGPQLVGGGGGAAGAHARLAPVDETPRPTRRASWAAYLFSRSAGAASAPAGRCSAKSKGNF